MRTKKIVIVSDHAGFYLKEKLFKFLIKEKYDVKDMGCSSAEPPVDYPDYGHPMAEAISAGEYDLGISICGTGNGINMVVNKHQGIRSALCWNEEISRLARAHNDANVCALPGRFINESEAYLIVKTFLSTEFDGGRHKPRIEKIPFKKVFQMLSNSCRYGIRAVIYLAGKDTELKTGIKQIGSELDLPVPFLGKILQQLAKQKILKSMKGPNGGFSILKDPRSTTIYDIVAAIDGEDTFTDCIMHNGPCRCVDRTKKPCPIHDDYAQIRSELIQLFKSRTIYDLVKKASNPDLVII